MANQLPEPGDLIPTEEKVSGGIQNATIAAQAMNLGKIDHIARNAYMSS